MQRILLKLSGELFFKKHRSALRSVVDQISSLCSSVTFGIVVGGGNIFRGNSDAKDLGIKPPDGHEIGMLATLVNGRMLQALFEAQGIPSILTSALSCPSIGPAPVQRHIQSALRAGQSVIFAGGTGNPFVTTDTNAVIRALQIQADAVWKATNVDGVYSADPSRDDAATLLKTVSYDDVLSKKLSVMDLSAIALAQSHEMTIRVFNIFGNNALLNAQSKPCFGSTVSAN